MILHYFFNVIQLQDLLNSIFMKVTYTFIGHKLIDSKTLNISHFLVWLCDWKGCIRVVEICYGYLDNNIISYV